MSDAIFRPRPYEEIYAEQAYLTTSLEVQSSRANELLRQYSWLEDALQNMTASKQRRSLRKQLNLVRSQLGGAAQQEKAIFIRLSEVYMELHSRDAWAQASRQRTSYRGVLGQSWNSPAIRGNPSSGNSMPSAHVNGVSPEFVPMNRRAVQRPMGVQVESRAGQLPTSSLTVPSLRAPNADGSGLDTADECPRDHGLSRQYLAAAGRSNTWEGPSLACRTGRDNRLSLPNLESIWPK